MTASCQINILFHFLFRVDSRDISSINSLIGFSLAFSIYNIYVCTKDLYEVYQTDDTHS